MPYVQQCLIVSGEIKENRWSFVHLLQWSYFSLPSLPRWVSGGICREKSGKKIHTYYCTYGLHRHHIVLPAYVQPPPICLLLSMNSLCPHVAASALDEQLSQSSTVSLKIWGYLVVLHPQFSHGFKRGCQLVNCPSHNIREGRIAFPAIYIFP